jgi:hypothetical protein
MRFNDFQNDPLSMGDPSNAIASRLDLYENKTEARTFGAIDGKVTSLELLKMNAAWAQSGPTHDQ